MKRLGVKDVEFSDFDLLKIIIRDVSLEYIYRQAKILTLQNYISPTAW
jgi:hypothetical protein